MHDKKNNRIGKGRMGMQTPTATKLQGLYLQILVLYLIWEIQIDPTKEQGSNFIEDYQGIHLRQS